MHNYLCRYVYRVVCYIIVLRTTSPSIQYKVTYQSIHDQTVPALLNIPKSGSSPFPCIIFLHGYTGRKEDVNMGCDLFSSQGYAIFAIDAPLDGLYYAQALSPRPLLMQNGRFDTLVPPETNKLLYEKAKEPKHIDWYNTGHFLPISQVLRRTLSWYNYFLKPKDLVVVDPAKNKRPEISNLQIISLSIQQGKTLKVFVKAEDVDNNLALVKAYFPFSDDEILLNDAGKSPDKKASDGIYSASYHIPKQTKPGKFKVSIWAADLCGAVSSKSEKSVEILKKE